MDWFKLIVEKKIYTRVCLYLKEHFHGEMESCSVELRFWDEKPNESQLSVCWAFEG